MKFEKINDNKINIILDLNDLKENHLDLLSFMSNSLESQNLFVEILKQAAKETGFVTNNDNIHIEAFSTTNGTFIFTITKANLLDIPKFKKIIYKRKFPKSNKGLIIYSFNSFDDYCSFCRFLNNIPNLILENSTLIQYNSKYYLILTNLKMNSENLKCLFTYISEFANLCSSSNFFANILLEHGEILIAQNAIEVGIRYFG